MKRLLLPLLLFSATIVLTACPQVEKNAYSTLVGAKAFLDYERTAHPECTTATTQFCTNLKQAVGAKDALADALIVYCAGSGFDANGGCQPPAKGTALDIQATAKLKAALALYNDAAKNLKTAVN